MAMVVHMDLLIGSRSEEYGSFRSTDGQLGNEYSGMPRRQKKEWVLPRQWPRWKNIDYIGMAESLDIGTVINKKMITASHIYQMMLDADVSNVKCLTFLPMQMLPNLQ